MKQVLFIDRDGTLIKEHPPTFQIDSWEKLEFYPYVFRYMSEIAKLPFELVMVTNQDGLGTNSFPEEQFLPIHQHILKSFENEGVIFHAVFIDRSHPHENLSTRKPGTGLLKDYINSEEYDIRNSFVIGDRITDVQLAKNLGCRAIWLNNHPGLGEIEISDELNSLKQVVALETTEWKDIYEYLKKQVKQDRDFNPGQ